MRCSPLFFFLVLVIAPIWLGTPAWLTVGEAMQAPSQPPPSPQAVPPSSDKSDPLFQEFIKEVEKQGPMLHDPARPGFPPPPTNRPNPHWPASAPTLSPEQQGEMRWQTLEQLLRNAREIRSQGEQLRTIGDPETGEKLIGLAEELRRTAIQIAPTR